jgi:hypothetical protein
MRSPMMFFFFSSRFTAHIGGPFDDASFVLSHLKY